MTDSPRNCLGEFTSFSFRLCEFFVSRDEHSRLSRELPLSFRQIPRSQRFSGYGSICATMRHPQFRLIDMNAARSCFRHLNHR